MKNLQTIAIFVLLFLLLSSLGGVYYLNKKYEDAKNENLKTVDVVVADKNISAMHQISDKDIKIVKLPKAAVTYRILQKEEIVGKYANISIYSNEPILEQKISAKLQFIADSNLSAAKDRFNIKFALFQNPNYSLKKGDKIDIIGLHKNNTDPADNNFEVTYTARSIKVLDFLKNGISQEKPSIKLEQQKAEESTKGTKQPKTPPVIFADELVLDMNSEEIARTLHILNKNQQLWMVLSNENRDEEGLKKIRDSFFKATQNFTRPATKEHHIHTSQPMMIQPQRQNVSTPATPQPPAAVNKNDRSPQIRYESGGELK